MSTVNNLDYYRKMLQKQSTEFKDGLKRDADFYSKLLKNVEFPAAKTVTTVKPDGTIYDTNYGYVPMTPTYIYAQPVNWPGWAQDPFPPLQNKSADQVTDNLPNKMAQRDNIWGTKVAWSSQQLLERQKHLETYNVEMAMLFEAVRVVTSRLCKREVVIEELEFYVNLSSPIVNNKHQISVTLQKPVALLILLYRELIDGRLDWSAEIGTTSQSQVDIFTDLRKAGGKIPLNPFTVTRSDEEAKEFIKRRQRRKVTL